MKMTEATIKPFRDTVEYEQWIVWMRLARIEAAEIETRKCDCPLCKELWHS